MGKYNGAVVTSAGQSLIANAVASNQKIIFTTLKASTHVYASTTDFEAMTSIADIVQSVDISYAGVYNSNVIQVSGRFTNTGVATAFAINTIGLYGKVGNGAETLVAVVTAVNADTMPIADPVSPTSIIYNIQMTVQNSGVMEVEVNDAGTINVHQFNDALYSTAAITVPTTGWTASGSQYTKTIDVGGITSSSMPFVELRYPDNVTATQKKAIDKAASKLVSLTTTNYGQVVLTATEVPATSFNLLLRGLGSGQYTQPYNEFFTTVLDKEPYVSRTARDGLVKIPQLVGGTVAWNQRVEPRVTSDTSQTNNGITIISKPDGSIVIDGTATASMWVSNFGSAKIPIIHKTSTSGHKLLYMFSSIHSFKGRQIGDMDSGYDVKNDYNAVIVSKRASADTADKPIQIRIMNGDSFDNVVVYPIVADLTQMFGTAIADYVYSLEQAEAGSGIAWLQSYGFFTKDYYAYDAGSLQSVCTSGRKITALDGTVRTYPIDNEELRGLFKLDANNKLYADGDIYPPSGSGTRKYALLKFTSCYSVNQSNGVYYATFVLNPIGINNSISFITNQGYKVVESGVEVGNTYITGSGGVLVICIYDQTITTKSAMNSYLADNALKVVYELNEPTTFSADPFINPQRSEGTEEFVDGLTRDVMIPVGNESTYFMSDVIPIMSEYIDAVTSS